jgi:malonyl CoA-acyl carrier protein transacylase
MGLDVADDGNRDTMGMAIAVGKIETNVAQILAGQGRIETTVGNLDRRQQQADKEIALLRQESEQQKADVAKELALIAERHAKEDEKKSWITYGQPLGSLVGVAGTIVLIILYLRHP